MQVILNTQSKGQVWAELKVVSDGSVASLGRVVFVITVDEKEKKQRKMRKIWDLQTLNLKQSSKLLLLQHYFLPTYYLLFPVQAYEINLEESSKG